MASSQSAGLTRAAQFLKNAAPREFQEFINEFNTYTHEVTVAVTEAPSDAVLQMQGRAQQARAILRCLIELK